MRLEDAESSLLRPDVDVSDLTASVRVGSATWDGETLVIPFDPDPSTAEQVLIRRRMMTRDAAHEAWVAALVASVDLLPNTAVGQVLRLLALERIQGIHAP